MKVGIIGGTGRMGMCIARHLAKQNEVIIGSRDPSKAKAAAAAIRGAAWGEYRGAASRADSALFAIPYAAIGHAKAWPGTFRANS